MYREAKGELVNNKVTKKKRRWIEMSFKYKFQYIHQSVGDNFVVQSEAPEQVLN